MLIHWPLGFKRYFQFFNQTLWLIRVVLDLEIPISAGKCASTRNDTGITVFLCSCLAIPYQHILKRIVKGVNTICLCRSAAQGTEGDGAA